MISPSDENIELDVSDRENIPDFEFWTARDIGIVRTMAIFAHLTSENLCDEMLRYCEANTYIIVIMIYRSNIWSWVVCFIVF